MNNILYCGMADDIITPIQLIPDFDNIFAICKFDSAFSRDSTWEGQKEDIKDILWLGNNKESNHFRIYGKYRKGYKVDYLPDPCIITNESDTNNCWSLEFVFNNKLRKLIYFHDTDFEEPWDKSIKNISHLFSIGAPFNFNLPLIQKMIKERNTSNYKYYDQFTKTENTTIIKSNYHEFIHITKLNSGI